MTPHDRVQAARTYDTLQTGPRGTRIMIAYEEMVRQVEAAVAEERDRCLKGYQSLNEFFINIQECEHAKRVQKWIEWIREGRYVESGES